MHSIKINNALELHLVQQRLFSLGWHWAAGKVEKTPDWLKDHSFINIYGKPALSQSHKPHGPTTQITYKELNVLA